MHTHTHTKINGLYFRANHPREAERQSVPRWPLLQPCSEREDLPESETACSTGSRNSPEHHRAAAPKAC